MNRSIGTTTSLFASLLLLFLLSLLSLPSYAKERVFIFGYGSLMSTFSRTASAPDPEDSRFIPAKLNNHVRTWNLWAKRLGMRVLAVEKREQAFVNGLIYEVPGDNLAKFDRREGQAYRRTRLSINDLSFYTPEDSAWFAANKDDIAVYVYAPVKKDVSQEGGYYLSNPYIHSQKTIAQSYFNLVISGCIEVDKDNSLNGDFLADCIATLGHEGIPIEEDSAAPKSPSHPTNQVINARKVLAKKQEFLQTEWQEYLQQIEELLGSRE